VLEQLALNGWEGSVGEWLERLRDEFGISKTEAAALENRIGQTRELMRKLTTDMQAIRPELPFLVHDGNLLIDGTIDLLCHGNDGGVALFDYKFTEADDASVSNTYRRQMEIYNQAANRAYPNLANRSTYLVIISQNGTRLLKMEF
jgi:ATP-dependent exoDNAse (exonuclease V) beta subunit